VVRILARNFAEEHASKITWNGCAICERGAADESLDGLHHLVDSDRNVCSFINSICPIVRVGDRLQQDRHLLQNRGGGFRIQPGHPNWHRAGQAAAAHHHSITVTKAGRSVMPFGVMGGQYQPVGQVHCG